MQELIKIHKSKGGKDIVSAKDLYEALELREVNWARWSRTNIEQCPDNLEKKDWVKIENISLCTVKSENQNQEITLHKDERKDKRRPFLITTDYAITIQFAKRLAMQTRSPKRREVQDYFLRCEEMAKAVLLPAINVTRVEVLANTSTEMQKANSKNIAAKLFTENKGEIKPIMDFHRANCEQVTGLLPHQVKKQFNTKSGSALEVLRKNAPHLAATCSLNSYLVFERGANLSQLKELDKHFNAAFAEFAKIGIHLTD